MPCQSRVDQQCLVSPELISNALSVQSSLSTNFDFTEIFRRCMLKCFSAHSPWTYERILRTVCYSQDSVLFSGQCAILRTVCYSQDSVLFSGQCAILRTVCYSQGSVLFSGQCAILRTVCYSQDSVLCPAAAASVYRSTVF